jgi:HPt (histidine-containing phosphotransfer) domain-containing protein
MLMDLTHIKEISKGDEKFTLKSIDLLLQILGESVPKMGEYLAAQQWERLSGEAHKIRPCANLIGMKDMELKLLKIEDCCRNKTNLEEVAPLVESIKSYVLTVTSELQSAREEITKSVH